MTLDVQVRRLAVGGRPLIERLQLSVPAGAVHTLMGESGSGKSSLLAAICGTAADAVDFDGAVRLQGQALDDLPTRHRGIGILFQDGLLFPHMTVEENLLFAVPPGLQRERKAAVQGALQSLELPEFAKADPATLSGGQRARVALARAFLANPRALLLDEPFGRLDAGLRQRMRELVFAAVRERGIPALLVTHDAEDVADRGRLTVLPPTPS